MTPDALTLPGVEVPPLSCRLDVSVWGFDVSTRRIALGVVQGRGIVEQPEVGWFSLAIEQFDVGPLRLAGLLAALPPFFKPIARAAPPAGILVEKPFGQPSRRGGAGARPHPSSYHVLGVLLAVLATEFPTAVIDNVVPGEWKAEALGVGSGASKKAAILRWARVTLDYTGQCDKCHALGSECDHAARAHDEADALGVVTSAAIRWQRDGRLR